MAEQSTVARPYAKALYACALEANLVSPWLTILEALTITVAHPSVALMIDDPESSHAELQQFLLAVIHDAVDISLPSLQKQVENGVAVLIQWHRLSALEDIYVQYQKIIAQQEGIKQLNVASAYELLEDHRHQLLAALEQRFDSKVAINYSIDQELMGGFVVRFEDWVMDCSISGKLARLSDSLI